MSSSVRAVVLACLALGGCQRELSLFLPAPPRADDIASQVFVLDGLEDRRLAVVVDSQDAWPLIIDNAEDERFQIEALQYRCPAATLRVDARTPSFPLPRPFRRYTSTLSETERLEWQEAPASETPSDIAEQRGYCARYLLHAGYAPGTEGSTISAAFVAAGPKQGIVAVVDGRFFSATNENEPVEPLAWPLDLPRLAAARDDEGHIWLLGKDGRLLRRDADGRFTAFEAPKPMLRATLAVRGAGADLELYALWSDPAGAAHFGTFDGARLNEQPCALGVYARVPFPKISFIGPGDALLLLPAELDRSPDPLPGMALRYKDGVCRPVSLPDSRIRISAGSFLPALGLAIAEYQMGLNPAARGSVYLREPDASSAWRTLDLDQGEEGRGVMSVLEPTARGFAFATYLNVVGEYSPTTGFCVAETGTPSFPFGLLVLDDGLLVISKGDYDPVYVDECESMAGCLPVQLLYYERDPDPRGLCSGD